MVCDVIDALLKEYGDEVYDACTQLVIDYSSPVPYSSELRADGRMKINCWTDEDARLYKDVLTTCLTNNFLSFDNDVDFTKIIPPLNGLKGLGFYKWLPSRQPLSTKTVRESFFVLPKALEAPGLSPWDNLWARTNNGPLKLNWLLSGNVLENIQYMLENGLHYDDPVVYFKGILKGAVSIHTEAYRINNGDPALNDFHSRSAISVVREGLYKKSREVSIELPSGDFFSGMLDDPAFERDFRLNNPTVWGLMLKKRPIFPGPTMTQGIGFSMLMRAFFEPAENGISGFLSNSPLKVSRYARYHETTQNYGKILITCDRRTAERFITDNFEFILSFMPDFMQPLMKAICTSIVPSEQGPRVVTGLVSGAPPTTAINVMTGSFEQGLFAAAALGLQGERRRKFLEIYWTNLFNPTSDWIEFDDFIILANLPTDDCAFYIAKPGLTDQQMRSLVKENLNKTRYNPEERFLSPTYEFGERVFGLQLNRDSIEVSAVLGLNKIFLSEHSKLGDQTALKYIARFRSLAKYYDIFQAVYDKHGFGTISTYERGAANYLANLRHFGYHTDGSSFGITEELIRGMFNEYEFSERITLSKLLDQYGFRIDEYVDKPGSEVMRPIYDLFKTTIKR
jgi:hypothetical protein